MKTIQVFRPGVPPSDRAKRQIRGWLELKELLRAVGVVKGSGLRNSGLRGHPQAVFAGLCQRGWKCTLVAVRSLSVVFATLVLGQSLVPAQSAVSVGASVPRFRVLAL